MTRESRTARPLIALVADERGWMALAVLLGFATIGSGIGLMMTSSYLIARAALQPSIADVRVPITGVRFFGIARGVFRYLERLVTHDATFRILARLREWFFRAAVARAPELATRWRSGDALNRVVSDVETLENAFARLVAPPLTALLIAGLCAWLFARFGGRLSMVLLAGYAFGGVAVPLITQALARAAGARLVALRAEIQACAVDAVQGLADLLVFNRAADHRRHLDALSAEWADLQRRLGMLAGLHEALTTLAMNATVLGMLAAAAPMVRDGALSGVLLSVVSLGVMAAFEAVTPLPQAFLHLEQVRGAAERVFAIGEAEPPTAARSDPEPSPCGYDLQIDGISFCYAADAAPVLRGVSLDVPAGSKVAVVGASGSGKTTLARLLARLHEPSTGAIRIGGCDLRAFDSDGASFPVTVVPQYPWLFNGTIRENLRMARPDATDEELQCCADRAQAAAFIDAMPDSWDTQIGEQGLHLSGGQRRRLAVARGLLQEAPILVFDEPTADLDAATERALMEALWSVDGRTVIVITHRLVGLDRADRVVVIEDGRIVQQGPHAALAAVPGRYRDLLAIQREAALFG